MSTEIRINDDHDALLSLHVQDPSDPPLPSTQRSYAALGSPMKTTPARWKTLEFYIYYVCIAFSILSMGQIAYTFSIDLEPKLGRYLSKGWLFGKQDNSDYQYGSFRNNIPTLMLVMMGHILVSFLIRNVAQQPHIKQLGPWRLSFSLVFSILFHLVLYGTNMLKVVAVIGVSFLMTKSLASHKLNPIIAWVYGISVLLLTDRFHDFELGSILNILSFLDKYDGMQRSWWGPFNFLLLKMISFTMDYYYKCQGDQRKLRNHRQDCQDCTATQRCYKSRVEESLPDVEYSFSNYLAYCMYAPLYMAGPIITFNDFVSQMKFNTTRMNVKETLIYAGRLIAVMVLMEWMMHHFYIVAISRAKAWDQFTAAQFGVFGFIFLKLIWLKLLIIWRFFRLWAMADGISTIENMRRCMSNNYSGMEFWRTWHRSYNRWLIRYVYVPLGGSKYYIYNVWPIFTFVAVWHDLNFKLLAWGWLISLFMIPEVAARKIFMTREWQKWRFHRHLCALGGACNVWLMCAANLVGFAVGLEGIQLMLTAILTPSGIGFIIAAFIFLYPSVHIMFEYREYEKRNKITMD